MSLRGRLGAQVYGLAMSLERRASRLRVRIEEADGLPMTFDVGGPADAPAVVLLHGYSADRNIWHRFAGHLVRDHHVIVPDLAGHGDTPFVSGAGYSAPDQARRVLALLDTLGIQRAHVLGNSMGGMIAATLALHHPDRVHSIGLSDAAGVTPPEPALLDERLAAGDNPFLLADVSEFDAFYALTMARPPYVPGIVRAALAQDYVDRREGLEEIWADFYRRFLLDDDLGRIATPAWVMWGSEDQLVHPSAAQVYADGLPNATLTTYDGIGHMPMLEIPKQTAADYRAFLDAL